MGDFTWVWLALSSTVFLAAFILINQYFKISGRIMTLYSRIFSLIMMIAFVVIQEIKIIYDPLFVFMVFLTALIGVYGDTKVFDVAKEYGGGVLARITPIRVWISFILWIIFKPESISKYQDKPLQVLGIMVSLLGCVYFASKLNKCNVTKAVFILLLPVLVLSSFGNILNKYAMDISTDLSVGVISYMYLQTIFVIILLLVQILIKPIKDKDFKIFDKKVLIAGGLVAVSWVIFMILKNYSMAYVDNPGYFVAITLIVPILISIIYKFTNHKEEADVKSGIGMVFFVFILVLATTI